MLFPIMGAPAIPWDAIAPHERQAQRNHSQSVQRLAERGGLSPCEAVAVLEDREWEHMDDAEAKRRLVEFTAPFEASARRIAELEAQLASLSPAPAPLKELIATWSRNADFQEVAEGVAYDSVEFVQRQTIAQTLWMCANELEAAMSALSPPPPTAEDGGDVFALAATLLKPYHGSYRVFIKEVARLRALDGSPQPPSEERK